MNVDIRTIPQGHSDFQQNSMLTSVSELLPPLKQAVECRASIDRNGATLFFNLSFNASVELECSRCLKQYNEKVTSSTYLIIKENPGHQGVAEDDSEADFYFDSSIDFLDLSPAIYDEIMTALPMMPLCSKSCKGIEMSLPGVHYDALGEKKGEKPIDSRWEALLKLKNKKQD
ncbi:DUF177 domain-containing protein [Chitinispirillales bacterium ANBcel5]|uniref:YceD family protein n=1 Tax=Cellulosispirillum alkaliphilum TaxID=3039283 RepID=UPI002A573302|nr:DUF177 domain-containing protein [Chitinispirillales bacterium ANBcel5]